MSCAFISKQKDYTVAKWAAFFEVSGSGYYAWIQNKERRIKREEQYAKAVKEAFESGEGTYGVDRVCGVMRRFGRTASFYKVARHMKAMG